MFVNYSIDRGNTGTVNLTSGFQDVPNAEAFIDSLSELAELRAGDSSSTKFPVSVETFHMNDGVRNNNVRVYHMGAQAYLDFLDAADDMFLIAAGKRARR